MSLPSSHEFPGGGDFRPHVGEDDRIAGAYEGAYLDPEAEAAWGRLYGDAVPVASAEPEAQVVAGTNEELLRLWSHAIDNEDYALAARIQAEASGTSESVAPEMAVLPQSFAADFFEGDPRQGLIAEVLSAEADLKTLGRFLATEAIGEGDPSRDVTRDPLYLQAQERLVKAQDQLGKF